MARGQSSEPNELESSLPLHQQLSTSKRSFRKSRKQQKQEQARQKPEDGDSSAPFSTSQTSTAATSTSLMPPMRKLPISSFDDPTTTNPLDDDCEAYLAPPPPLRKQASIGGNSIGGGAGDYAMKYLVSSPPRRTPSDVSGGYHFNDSSSVFSFMSGSSHRRKDWTCDACSYHNVDKYNDQCALCGSTKKEDSSSSSSGVKKQESPLVHPKKLPVERKGIFNRRQQAPDVTIATYPSASPEQAKKISGSTDSTLDHNQTDNEPSTERKSSLGLFSRRKSEKKLSSNSPSRFSSSKERSGGNNKIKHEKEKSHRRRPSAGSVGISTLMKSANDGPQQQEEEEERRRQHTHKNKEDDYHDELQPPAKPMSDRSATSEPLQQPQPGGKTWMHDDSSSSTRETVSIANGSTATVKASNLLGKDLLLTKSVFPSSPARSDASPMSFNPVSLFGSSDHRRKPSQPPPVTPEHGIRGGRLLSVGSARSTLPVLPSPPDSDDEEPNLFDDAVEGSYVQQTNVNPVMYPIEEDREHPSNSYLPHSMSHERVGQSDTNANVAHADPTKSKVSSTTSVTSTSSHTSATSQTSGLSHTPYVAASKTATTSPRNSANLANTQHTLPTQYSSFTETSHDSIEVDLYQPYNVRSNGDIYRPNPQGMVTKLPSSDHFWNGNNSSRSGSSEARKANPPTLMQRSPFSISTYEDDEYDKARKKRKRFLWVFIAAVVILGVIITTTVVVTASKRDQEDHNQVSVTENTVVPTAAPMKTSNPFPTVAQAESSNPIPTAADGDAMAGAMLMPVRNDDTNPLPLAAATWGTSGMGQFGSAVDLGGPHGNLVAVAGNSFVRVLRYQPDEDQRRSLLRRGSDLDKASRRMASGGTFEQVGNYIPTKSASPLISLAPFSQLTPVDATAAVEHQVVAISQNDSLTLYRLHSPTNLNKQDKNSIAGNTADEGGDDLDMWRLLGNPIQVGSVNAGGGGGHTILGSAVSLARGGSRVASGSIVEAANEESSTALTRVVIQVYDYVDGSWEPLFSIEVKKSHMESDDNSNTTDTFVGDIVDIQMQLSDAGDTLAVLLHRSTGGSKTVLVYPLEDDPSSQAAAKESLPVDPVPWQLKSEIGPQDYYYTSMALSGDGVKLVATSSDQETHVFSFSKNVSKENGEGGWGMIDTITESSGTSVSISEAGNWISVGETGSRTAGTLGSVSLYELQSSSTSSDNGHQKYQLVSRLIEPNRDSAYGKSVSMSNESLAVGAPQDEQHGKVYFYRLPERP